MTFRKEKGRYEGVTSDDRVVKFEDGEEMIACAELRDSLLMLLGREPENVALYSPVDERCSPLQIKKTVRIKIDTDVEFIEKALA